MNDNNILNKAFQFAIRIVELQRYLVNAHREYVLSKQLLWSGTSIGTNINEAQAEQSHTDFIAKILLVQSEELIKILTSIVETALQNQKK